MPLREPDGTDPMELTGVVVPSGEDSLETMVRVYAEEYARLGWSRDRILATCRSPWYRSVHGAWLALGEERVRALVDEALEPFPPSRGGRDA